MAKTAVRKSSTTAPASPAKSKTRIYQVLKPSSYERDGKVTTYWTQVGVGFASKDGEGFNLEIPPGISVSGRLVIRPLEPTKAGETREHAAAPAPSGAGRFVHDYQTPLEDMV